MLLEYENIAYNCVQLLDAINFQYLHLASFADPDDVGHPNVQYRVYGLGFVCQ